MGLFGGSKTDPSTVWGGQSGYLTDLYSRGQQASYGNMGQDYSQQFQQPAFNAFNQQAQGGASQGFGQQQNQYLDASVGSGLDQMMQNFQRNIMPGINQGAAMSGTSGGSRQGIAQSNAANDANTAAGNFVNQMYSQNFQNQMQNQLQSYGMQNQAQQGAMGQAPQLSNLGFGSQYGNLSSLAGIIGSPTILGGGSQTDNGMIAPLKFGYTGGG